MSRRDISKRERLRMEEKEIDKQLQDAGFDIDGLSTEDKKGILQMLEESRKCAQEEEDRRKKEDQIFIETLNKSFSEKSDVKVSKPTNSASESNTNVLTLDVKASEPIPEHNCKNDEPSDSGSTTPELFPSPAGTPTRTATNHEQLPSGKSFISTESSRSSQDMFLFSQSSTKLGIEKNAIENCIEAIRVSDDDDDHDVSCSPSIINSPVHSNSVVKNKLSSSPSARVPLRMSKPADICTPSSGTQSKENDNAKCNSQIFTVDTKPEGLTRLTDSETDLMSPIIGQRHIVPFKDANLTSVKEVSRVENVEVPDFISVKPLNPVGSGLVSNVGRGEPENSPTSVRQNELVRPQCETKSLAEPKSVIEELPKKESHKRKSDVLEDDGHNNFRGSNKLLTTISDSIAVRNSPRNLKKMPFPSLSLSDSDEDLNIMKKREKKKCVNVFFIQDASEVALKRHSGKSEDPRKAYFKSKNESICSGYERILNLMNISYEKLQKYQSSIAGRIPWSAPIGVDKRVKDALDRPRVPSKKLLDLPHSGDIEPPRMVTRNAPKPSRLQEEDADSSNDSLPELTSASSGWIDANKISTKRRGLQLGLGRKQTRLETTAESSSKTKDPATCLNVINESDSEDFDMHLPGLSSFPKTRKPFRSDGGASEGIGRVTPPAQVEEEKTNFEMGDILADSQKNPSGLLRESKESSPVNGKNFKLDSVCKVEINAQPSTSSSENKPRKRPRKTFRLSVEIDEESSENSDGLLILQDKSDVPCNEIVQMIPKDVLQSVSDQKSCGSPVQDSEVSSLRKKAPLRFLNSEDVESKDSIDTEERNFEDVRLVDGLECLPSTSNSSNINVRARKGKGKPNPLKPGPLKLKNKRGRGAVKAESPEPVIEDQPSPVSKIPPQDPSNGLPENDIECPLCQKCFPADKIEAHASDCVGPTEETTMHCPESNAVRTKRRFNNQKNDDVLVINERSDGGAKSGRILSLDNRRGRARTPPNHARCSFCSQVFKEGDEYFIHVQDCESEFQKSPSMSSINSRTPGKVQMSYSAADVSSSPIRSRPPIGKRPSVFEKLEGGTAIQVHLGDITDAVYRNPTTAIVHIVNCVAVRPHGLSQTLADKYPYCNTYKQRQPIDNLNRSCRADRGIPGNVEICRSHVNGRDPVVVDIFGQFYMGKAYNVNFTSKKLVSQMKRYGENGKISPAGNGSKESKQAMDYRTDEKYYDLHLLEGLQDDTSENRIKWFREALEKLAQSVALENIKTVVFPFGIGCGLAGGNWEKYYYPAIVRFSNMVFKEGVNVILVKKVEQTLSEQAQAAAGTQKTSRYSGTKNKKYKK